MFAAAWLLAPAVVLGAERPLAGSFAAGAQAEPVWTGSVLLDLPESAQDTGALSPLATPNPGTADAASNDGSTGAIEGLLLAAEVAEPESYALMLAGLALVGAYMRQRRRV